MKKTILTVIFVVIFVGLSIYLFMPTGPNDSELDKLFVTKYNAFIDTMNKTKSTSPVMYGKLARNTQPDIISSLAQRFGAKEFYNCLDDYKKAGKPVPKYKNADDTDFDLTQLDDGVVIPAEDSIIWINEDGFNSKDITLYIDVNGTQAPNIIGKDLFAVKVLPGDVLEPTDETQDAINRTK